MFSKSNQKQDVMAALSVLAREERDKYLGYFEKAVVDSASGMADRQPLVAMFAERVCNYNAAHEFARAKLLEVIRNG